jgi:SecD/SecF fusion protein
MKRNLFWKFLFVAFVVGWSVWELYPPTGRNLIHEFEAQAVNKDAEFAAIVETARQLDQEHPELTFQNLRHAIGERSITNYFPHIYAEVRDQRDPERAVVQHLQREAAGQIKLGLDLQGGTSFLVAMDTNKLEQAEQKDRVLAQAIEVLRKRVDAFGVAEPVIQPTGENMIEIQLPGLSEAEKEHAREQIQRAAFLEFRMVHENSSQLIGQNLIPPGYEVLTLIREEDGRTIRQPFLVKIQPEQGLTGQYVRRASVNFHPVTNHPEVSLTFTSEGAAIFAELTRRNVGRLLAIVLDGELYSAPVIRVPILDGRASISGDFSMAEAFGLANVLENPLEVPLIYLQEFSVEPSLGKDSIRSGVRASLIGLILVAAFMLAYYLVAGLIANVALLLNLIILLGVLCSIEAALTLPGIAGIVLTIGMAVDANVLIFERIREELSAGKSLRGAVSAGYDKAFSTIFDANVTTLIASIILIFLGTGPVKGFGVTLTIGLTASMFTALVVTRLCFDWLLVNGWLKKLTMLQFVKPSHWDFLKWAKPAFVLSWALVGIGLGYAFYRGADIFGVDFRGGDRLTLSFDQKMEIGALRNTLVEAGFTDVSLQFQKDMFGEELLQVTSTFNTGPEVQETLKTNFPAAGFDTVQTYNVGPTIGQEILRTAVIAVLLAMFGILIYVAFRYEFSFALAATIAVLHDLFMTIGWFCLTGREFSAPMVAALLTIIGFSINDTIVIFDRVREDLKLGLRGSFKDVINHSLNKTLSRTIITSGTMLLATLALYMFGGPVINDFAFTFLVGIIVGTYSTIYIASAFVLWWHKGERPKAAAQFIAEEAVPVKA